MTGLVLRMETEVTLNPALLDEPFDLDLGVRATTTVGAIEESEEKKSKK